MRRQRKCFEKRKNFSYQALSWKMLPNWFYTVALQEAKNGVTFQRNNLKHKIIVDKLLNHYYYHPPSQVCVTDSRAASKTDQVINTSFIQNMHYITICSELSTKWSMKFKKLSRHGINNMFNVSSYKMWLNIHLEVFALQNPYHCDARVL